MSRSGQQTTVREVVGIEHDFAGFGLVSYQMKSVLYGNFVYYLMLFAVSENRWFNI